MARSNTATKNLREDLKRAELEVGFRPLNPREIPIVDLSHDDELQLVKQLDSNVHLGRAKNRQPNEIMPKPR